MQFRNVKQWALKPGICRMFGWVVQGVCVVIIFCVASIEGLLGLAKDINTSAGKLWAVC